MRGGKAVDPRGPKPPGGPTYVGPDPSEPETPPDEGGERTGKHPSPFDGPPDPEEGLRPEYEEGLSPEYETGSEYPAMDGDDPDEDIYGENDPFPDEDGEYSEPRLPTDELRAVPRPAEVTRIAPAVSIDEDEDDDGDENATRTGPPIHLEVISGPDQGRNKRFRGARMVVGRTEGCDFKLSDNSVSRRHLELVLGDNGVMLRDLGSGNGTRVNDEKVNEKLLEDGDEIAIGKTRFRFVDELAALKKKQEAEEAEAALAEAAAEAEGGEDEEASAEPDESDDEVPADDSEGEDDDAEARDDDEAGGDPEAEWDEHAPTAETKGRRHRKKPLVSAEGDRTAHIPSLASRRRPNRGGRAALQALNPAQKKVIAAAAGALVLVIVLLILLLPGKPPPPPPNPNVDVAAEKMQQARNALREEKFAEALALIAEAEKLQPGADQTGMAEGAKKELAAQEALAEVKALLDQGAYDQARAKLKDAPTAVVINEAKHQEVAAAIDAAENAYGRQKAEEALAAQDVETAEAIIEKLPPRMALELRPKLDEVKAAVAQQAAEEARDAKVASAAAARRAKERRQAFIDDAFVAVGRKFNQGEYARAALECDRVVAQHPGDSEIRQRARDLKKWMPLFGRYLDEGQRKYRSGALESAARPLRKAKALYAQIGFDGALGTIIDEQLAGAALAAGKAAMQRNDLGSAGDSFRLALKLNPAESRAQRGLDSIAEKAEELYLRAYMIRDREPHEAAGMFRTVMDALPKNSPTWEKAKAQLEHLGPQGP